MKMKRYSAPDIRQAISQVREELGPDAVILSNRTTDEGVELIAAIDYDETIFEAEKKTAKTKKPISPAPTSSSKPTTSAKPTIAASQDRLNKSVASRSYERNEKPATAVAAKTASRDQENETQVSKEWLAAFKAKFAVEEEVVAEKQSTVSVKPTANAGSDGEIKNLRSELNHLRDLLENQLSSLAWQDVSKRYPQRAKVLKSLFEMGITPSVSRKLIENIDFGADPDVIWKNVLAELTKKIPVKNGDIVQKGGVFALVGPTGIGKTTTIAKIAARYALNNGTKGIALVTTDNYRIGAQEQLRTYGRILGAPVRVVNDAMDLRKTLKSLYDKQLILIDTAGMSQRDVRLTEQFAMLSEGSSLIKTYLVLSASTQTQVAEETVNAFKRAVLDGCIISKIDESATIGGVLATAIQNQLPIAYISDGQRVPEDLHVANGADLVKRAAASLDSDSNSLDEDTLEFLGGGLITNE